MKKRLITILLLQVLWFGLLSKHIGLAYSPPASAHVRSDLLCGYDPRINIIPVLPTMNDAVSITTSGLWPDACIPEYQSHQVVSNTIRIDAVVDEPPGTFCLAVVSDWGFAVDVGNLLTGSYQVDLYLTDHRFTPTPTLCMSKPFLVVEQVQKAHLPLITK